MSDLPVDVGSFGGSSREKTTAEFVRDYLDEHGEAYPGEIHSAYTDWCDDHGYSGGSYASMRRLMWLLRDLGAIECHRTEESPRGPMFDRRYHRLTDEVDMDARLWEDPVDVRYGRE